MRPVNVLLPEALDFALVRELPLLSWLSGFKSVVCWIVVRTGVVAIVVLLLTVTGAGGGGGAGGVVGGATAPDAKPKLRVALAANALFADAAANRKTETPVSAIVLIFIQIPLFYAE